MLEAVLTRILQVVFGGGADISDANGLPIDISTDAEEKLGELISRLTEISIDSGDATSGSLITIVDTTKNWEVDKWKDAIVEVEVDGIHYYRTVSSNTLDTLTITTLPVGHPVAAGDHYNIRLSIRIVSISGQTVTVSSGHIHVVSGQVIAKVSGEVVRISGQIVEAGVSGTVVVTSGTVSISGNVVEAGVSGTVVVTSGEVVAKVSGEVVRISGQIVEAGVSGTVVVTSGSVSISGNVVEAGVSGTVVVTSGMVGLVSATVIVTSGKVVAKISGETVVQAAPTNVKTGPLRMIPANSGGVYLHSGTVISVTLKSLNENSGDIYMGGVEAGQMPYSGYGFLVRQGEAANIDIDNFNKVRLVAAVSGDRVTFMGANK